MLSSNGKHRAFSSPHSLSCSFSMYTNELHYYIIISLLTGISALFLTSCNLFFPLYCSVCGCLPVSPRASRPQQPAVRWEHSAKCLIDRRWQRSLPLREYWGGDGRRLRVNTSAYISVSTCVLEKVYIANNALSTLGCTMLEKKVHADLLIFYYALQKHGRQLAVRRLSGHVLW